MVAENLEMFSRTSCTAELQEKTNFGQERIHNPISGGHTVDDIYYIMCVMQYCCALTERVVGE